LCSVAEPHRTSRGEPQKLSGEGVVAVSPQHIDGQAPGALSIYNCYDLVYLVKYRFAFIEGFVTYEQRIYFIS
jgi:hypothetical protein